MEQFDLTPYGALPVEGLGIEELESRLEMSATASDVSVIISGVESTW